MSEFRVDVKIDTAALEAKYGAAAMARRLKAGVEELARLGQTAVRAAMPVDTGAARSSVQVDVRGSAVDVRGRVFSPLEYVEVLEKGRRPGARMPPIAPIAAWLSRHGADARMAFVVARSIGRRGTKAHHMFEQAAAKVQAAAEGIIARHVKG